MSRQIPNELVNRLRYSRAVMTEAEQLLLFALVFALAPQSVLEIGVFEGGSSRIILEALPEGGQLYSIDPNPQIDLGSGSIHHDLRWHLIRGSSPQAIERTTREIGGVQPFDFVLIDGDHSYEAVRAVINGVLPYLADETYLLFHDAYNPAVKRAIDTALGAEWACELLDCGMLAREPVHLAHMGADYYGMRLLRYTRSA